MNLWNCIRQKARLTTTIYFNFNIAKEFCQHISLESEIQSWRNRYIAIMLLQTIGQGD